MTLNELQRWIISNDHQDSWWVAIDGEVSDNLFALADISKLKDQYPNAQISVLHETKANEENAEWILFEKESPKKFKITSGIGIIKSVKIAKSPSPPREQEELSEGEEGEATAEPEEAGPEIEVEPEAASEPEQEAEVHAAPRGKAENAQPASAAATVSDSIISELRDELQLLKSAFVQLQEEVAKLRNLANDLKKPIEEARQVLREREEFLELSENSLFEKAQKQEVIQTELEQLREELLERERAIAAKEKELANK